VPVFMLLPWAGTAKILPDAARQTRWLSLWRTKQNPLAASVHSSVASPSFMQLIGLGVDLDLDVEFTAAMFWFYLAFFIQVDCAPDLG
jgi:hypothetical protein